MKRGALSLAVVLLLIGAVDVQPQVLAQDVQPESPTKAGVDAPKPNSAVSAYIEVRSAIPKSQKKAADEKPGRILRYGLNYADVDRIIQAVPAIREAVPIREIHKPIRRSNQVLDGRIIGTTASYSRVNRIKMDRGRFLSEEDNKTYQNLAVLGSDVARTLFPADDPIGQSVKLGTDYYTIVGVVKARTNPSVISGRSERRDLDKDVYIPLNTCKLRFGERVIIARGGMAQRAEESQLARLTLLLRDDANVEDTAALIRSTLIQPFHPKGDVEVIVVRLHRKPR
jgi:putative ABC transport system permease protein